MGGRVRGIPTQGAMRSAGVCPQRRLRDLGLFLLPFPSSSPSFRRPAASPRRGNPDPALPGGHREMLSVGAAVLRPPDSSHL